MRSQRKFNKEKNQKGRQSIRRVESGSQETLLEKKWKQQKQGLQECKDNEG